MSDVEDICADAFALAWSRLDDLCDLSDAQAHRWLQKVVEFRIKRTSRDFLRFERAVQKIKTESKKSTDSSEILFLEGLENQSLEQAAQQVVLVLEQLPIELQEILRWDIYERLKGPEIAKRVGCTPTAARLRLMRARKAFAAQFEKHWEIVNRQVAQ